MSFFELISLAGFGFILGLKHAIEPDHIAAVSTIASQTKNLKKSALLGALWGVGHTTTLFAAGIIVLLLKITIPQKVALTLEFAVGTMLVVIGADLLIKIIKGDLHHHSHLHEGVKHKHVHIHSPFDSNTHHHQHRSFVFGMIHGLAGSAALLVLTLATVPSIWIGLLFILVFGIGSIGGMTIASTIISLPSLVSKKINILNVGFQAMSALASIAIGLFAMYQIAIIEHLIL